MKHYLSNYVKKCVKQPNYVNVVLRIVHQLHIYILFCYIYSDIIYLFTRCNIFITLSISKLHYFCTWYLKFSVSKFWPNLEYSVLLCLLFFLFFLQRFCVRIFRANSIPYYICFLHVQLKSVVKRAG